VSKEKGIYQWGGRGWPRSMFGKKKAKISNRPNITIWNERVGYWPEGFSTLFADP